MKAPVWGHAAPLKREAPPQLRLLYMKCSFSVDLKFSCETVHRLPLHRKLVISLDDIDCNSEEFLRHKDQNLYRIFLWSLLQHNLLPSSMWITTTYFQKSPTFIWMQQRVKSIPKIIIILFIWWRCFTKSFFNRTNSKKKKK